VHREAAAYAAERNVVCAIEYLNRFECYFLNTIADAREYVGMVDHPNFGTMYDTFHANIEEKDPLGVIAPNIDVIKHVHISENDRGTPGKGHPRTGQSRLRRLAHHRGLRQRIARPRRRHAHLAQHFPQRRGSVHRRYRPHQSRARQLRLSDAIARRRTSPIIVLSVFVGHPDNMDSNANHGRTRFAPWFVLLLGALFGLVLAPVAEANPNWACKTMGGRQFWSDVAVRSGWRVQRNVATGHHRLLDANEVRRAWGSRQHCLDKLQSARGVRDPRGEVVVLLHGTFSHRTVVDKLAGHLAEEGSFEVVNVGYASTRAGIERHAADLASVIDRMGPRVTRIHFVAHSLGNLVIREYLRDAELSGRLIDSGKLGRFVMITPPNQGSSLARRFERVPGYHLFLYEVGRDLASHDLDQRLGTPPCAFGIIVGGTGTRGWNPLIRGDDDLILSVSDTKLAGASDEVFFRCMHKPMLRHKPAQQAALRFLQTGSFEQ